MDQRIYLLIFVCEVYVIGAKETAPKTFPPDFLFGAATSAYQIEGAWNVDGEYDKFIIGNDDPKSIYACNFIQVKERVFGTDLLTQTKKLLQLKRMEMLHVTLTTYIKRI